MTSVQKPAFTQDFNADPQAFNASITRTNIILPSFEPKSSFQVSWSTLQDANTNVEVNPRISFSTARDLRIPNDNYRELRDTTTSNAKLNNMPEMGPAAAYNEHPLKTAIRYQVSDQARGGFQQVHTPDALATTVYRANQNEFCYRDRQVGRGQLLARHDVITSQELLKNITNPTVQSANGIFMAYNSRDPSFGAIYSAPTMSDQKLIKSLTGF